MKMQNQISLVAQNCGIERRPMTLSGFLSLCALLIFLPGLLASTPMATPRYNHSATTLPDGKVLLAGGWNGESLSSAEIFDPATDTTTLTGSLNIGRYTHTATLLQDGKVLFTGGYNTWLGAVGTAEIFDPATGTFSLVGDLNYPRFHHSATLLNDGRVLVTGGYYADALSNAELYDPSTGTFTIATEMGSPRYMHTSILLPNGKVLIAGGQNGMATANTAELYDPNSGMFASTGNMVAARYYNSATVMAGGKVLFAGGFDDYLGGLVTAEIYDVATGSFSATGNMTTVRYLHTATLLQDGNILLAGAVGPCIGALATTEIFDSSTGVFSASGNMISARYGQTANLLNSGKILMAGGYNSAPLADVEQFEATSVNGTPKNQFILPGSMTEARLGQTATLLLNGSVLIAGNASGTMNTSELYDPATRLFQSDGMMNVGRYMHSASLLADGNVLLAGGYAGNPTASAEVYDANSHTFVMTASLNEERAEHSGTTLLDGKVLVAGGKNLGNILASAEIFDPVVGGFIPTGSMSSDRYEHTATLLQNGQVLITGGVSAGGVLNSAELFDPLTTNFLPVGSMNIARYYHRATLLADGRVLITGGVGADGGMVATVEIYEPASQTFTPTGSMNVARYLHTATTLPGGKVLIAGGYAGIFLNSVEIYDTATGTFIPGPSLAFSRYLHAATSLQDGNVLITGGYGDCGYLASSELYITSGQSTDNHPPVITGPESFVVEASSSAGAVVNFSATAFDDVDGEVTVFGDHASGATYPVGRTTVVLSASDHSGNTTTSSFEVIVQDTTAPVLAAVDNVIVEAVSSSGAIVTFTSSAVDIVDGVLPVTATPVSGSTFPLGSTKVVLSAMDSHGNRASREFTVTVQDTHSPILVLPSSIIAEATSGAGASVSFTIVATDSVDTSPQVLTSVPSPSQFPIGTTPVQVLAGDASGNITEGEFTVTVQDTTPPAIQVPANIVAEATSNSGATVSFPSLANDLVDGEVSASADPASGSVFPIGSTTVNLTAIDNAGNQSSSSFTIAVQDSTAPVIAPQENLVAEAQGSSGAIVNFTLSASDLVDSAIQVSAQPASGSTFPLGKTAVHVSATDSHGNTASSEFLVTVQDTTAPALQVPGKIVVEAQNSNGAPVSFHLDALDLVDGSVEATASVASGSVFPIGLTTVTVLAKDKTGNVAEGKFDILVQDTTAPSLQLPNTIKVEASGASGASVAFNVTATDSVDGAIVPVVNSPSGTTFPIGSTVVQVKATDAHGNSSQGSFTVVVQDTTAPILQFPNNIILEATSSEGAVSIFAVSASDLVDGSVPVTSSRNSGSKFPLGTTTVQVSSTDSKGNKSEGSFTVTVRDTTPPAITCPADIALDGKDNPVVTYQATVSDLVDANPTVQYSIPSGSTFPVGVTEVVVTATDASGNISTCSFRVGRAEHGKFKFRGFLDPIGGANATGGHSTSPVATFKYGATIPITFTASTADGQEVTSGVQTMQVFKHDPKKNQKDQKKKSTVSGKFRYAKGTWQYNLQTKQAKMEKGVWELVATLSDGSEYTAWIKIK
jgi:hypothetical protein